MNKTDLEKIVKWFEYYKTLGENTFSQLEEEDLFWQFNEESNSIAIMVNHLWGNMKSRWTDFLTSDGEKDWRKRDAEFEPSIQSRSELLEKWNDGWSCLFHALNALNGSDLHAQVLIRNQNLSVPEAINRQMMHYAYHIGQIVYVGRMIKGHEWKSLSIPKGESKAFNRKLFSTGKQHGDVTDDEM